MKLLLDTHTFIWLDTAPDKLSPAAFAACEDPNNQLYLSVISAWEIQIKVQLGRLKLDLPWEHMVEVQQVENGLQILPVTLAHISALTGLPQLHGDPFDRLLIAQAHIEQAQLVSSDSRIKHYPVDVIW